jgi:hypothetical protein
MAIEAGRIATRSIIQGAASLRMSLGCGGWIDEAVHRHAGERPAGGSQEVTS